MVEESVPALGDEFNGFILEAVDRLPEYHGTGYLFKHCVTGMEVYQVVNDDPELFFSYIFRTPPHNSSGVAHITEHAVLAGSRKYPVRDPFMALLKGSANTFMNAMTYPDRTLYPAASPVKKDFDNLFDVYTDAVFCPLLREETFWQEGVRIVFDKDGKLGFDGVVFNEMKGAGADHDGIVGKWAMRSLYPDTPYAYESGGDPAEIVKLDYQQFVAFHQTWYHPSNCRLFLFGALPVGYCLEKLDNEYLFEYMALMPAGPSPLAASWITPHELVKTSPAEADGDASSSVTLSWLTTLSEDPVEVITLSTLVDILLGNPGAPLYRAIIESGIGEDLSPESGMATEFRQMPFVVGYKGIDPSRAQEAQAFILATLESLVHEGIPRDQVETALKRQEFRLQEIAGGMPNGLRALSRVVRGWVQGKLPGSCIETSPAVEILKQRVDDAYKQNSDAKGKKPYGYFEQWIKTWLIDNPHRCLLTVVPDDKYYAKEQEQIDDYLSSLTSDMDEAKLLDIQNQSAQFTSYTGHEESPELLATIPRLSRDDLPQDISIIEQSYDCIAQTPVIRQKEFTNGIIYVDGCCSLIDLHESEHVLMPLFVRLMQMTGIGDEDYSQVAVKLRNLTGGFFLYLEDGTDLSEERREHSLMMFRMKALPPDCKAALSLIAQLFEQANLDSEDRIKAAIIDMKTEFSASVMGYGNAYASQRASIPFSSLLQDNEVWNGMYQWNYLQDINLEDPDALKALGMQLKALQRKLFDRNRYTLHLCADEALLDEASQALETAFLDLLPKTQKKPKQASRSFTFETPIDDSDRWELFTIPATVSYTSLALRSAPAGSDLQAWQTVLGYLLTTNHLWTYIRGNGGAYGAESHVDMMEELFLFSSYRDPRIAGTYEDYLSSLREVIEGTMHDDVLELAIVSFIGKELRPLAPQEKAMTAFRRALYHISDEFRRARRNAILTCTLEDLRNAAKDLLERFQDKHSSVVLSGQSLFDEEKALLPALNKKAQKLLS